MAADLPRRAAPPEYFAPVPVFTWTGFYVGVNAGYAWTNDNNADSTVFVPAGSLSTVLTPLTPPAGTFVNTFGFNNSRSGDGFTFGGTLGYNWQTAGGFVWGVEGDINWVDIGGSGNDAFFGGGFNTTTFAGGGAAINRTYDIVSATRSSGFDWFGTARVRLGWAIDRTLIYANWRLRLRERRRPQQQLRFRQLRGLRRPLQQQQQRLAHRMDDRRRRGIRFQQQPDRQARGPVGEP